MELYLSSEQRFLFGISQEFSELSNKAWVYIWSGQVEIIRFLYLFFDHIHRRVSVHLFTPVAVCYSTVSRVTRRLNLLRRVRKRYTVEIMLFLQVWSFIYAQFPDVFFFRWHLQIVSTRVDFCVYIKILSFSPF